MVERAQINSIQRVTFILSMGIAVFATLWALTTADLSNKASKESMETTRTMVLDNKAQIIAIQIGIERDLREQRSINSDIVARLGRIESSQNLILDKLERNE